MKEDILINEMVFALETLITIKQQMQGNLPKSQVSKMDTITGKLENLIYDVRKYRDLHDDYQG